MSAQEVASELSQPFTLKTQFLFDISIDGNNPATTRTTRSQGNLRWSALVLKRSRICTKTSTGGRLATTIYILCLQIGMNIHEKELVERALRPKDPSPAILDVGTGSGSWAVDMAKRFSHAEVVGLDLVPPMLLTEDEIPANCRFEIDDANLGLDHFEGFFDLVHVRCTDSGLNDVNGWFYEIAKTMRPGGVLIIANGSIQNYDANLQPLPVTYPGEPGFTWIQHLCGVVYEAYHSKGHFAPDNSMYWDDWIRENPNFTHFRRRDYFIPIGPWKPNMSEREVQVANLQREALIRVLHAYKPLMLSQGHQESEVDMWIERSIAEVRDLTLHGHANWEYTIAVRLDTPWQPRPEVSHSEPEPRRKRFVRTRQARSEP